MTPRQRRIARYALCLPNATNRSARNRLFADETSPDWSEWMAMVDAGLAVHHPAKEGQKFSFFRLTRAGADRALDEGETLRLEDFPSISAH